MVSGLLSDFIVQTGIKNHLVICKDCSKKRKDVLDNGVISLSSCPRFKQEMQHNRKCIFIIQHQTKKPIIYSQGLDASDHKGW